MRSDRRELYKEASSYGPQPGKEYRWVLDYARFRLEFTFENGRYIEEKSLSLVKTVLAVAAGAWAVFSLMLSAGSIPTWPVKLLVILAIASVLGSGVCALRAFAPSDRLVPTAEDDALGVVDNSASHEAAMATFSLILKESTEYQSKLTSQKGVYVRWGVRLVYLGVALFSAALFWVVFR